MATRPARRRMARAKFDYRLAREGLGCTRNRRLTDYAKEFYPTDPVRLHDLLGAPEENGRTKRVCDVGCGYGHAAEDLRKTGFKVTAIDAFTRPTDGVAGAMEALPLHSNSQDRLLACVVHNYSFNKLKALQEAHRVLVPGGVAVIQVHPEMPVVFKARGRSLRLALKDVLKFLQQQGHDLRLKEAKYGNRLTLEMHKNKPALGLNARLTQVYPLRGLDSVWLLPELEPACEYHTNRKTFERLEKFVSENRR